MACKNSADTLLFGREFGYCPHPMIRSTIKKTQKTKALGALGVCAR
jgi:hypothetical protein